MLNALDILGIFPLLVLQTFLLVPISSKSLTELLEVVLPCWKYRLPYQLGGLGVAASPLVSIVTESVILKVLPVIVTVTEWE